MNFRRKSEISLIWARASRIIVWFWVCFLALNLNSTIQNDKDKQLSNLYYFIFQNMQLKSEIMQKQGGG